MSDRATNIMDGLIGSGVSVPDTWECVSDPFHRGPDLYFVAGNGFSLHSKGFNRAPNGDSSSFANADVGCTGSRFASSIIADDFGSVSLGSTQPYMFRSEVGGLAQHRLLKLEASVLPNRGLLCASGANAVIAGKVLDPTVHLSLGPHDGGKATAGASESVWHRSIGGFLVQTNPIGDWVSGTDLVGLVLSAVQAAYRGSDDADVAGSTKGPVCASLADLGKVVTGDAGKIPRSVRIYLSHSRDLGGDDTIGAVAFAASAIIDAAGVGVGMIRLIERCARVFRSWDVCLVWVICIPIAFSAGKDFWSFPLSSWVEAASVLGEFAGSGGHGWSPEKVLPDTAWFDGCFDLRFPHKGWYGIFSFP